MNTRANTLAAGLLAATLVVAGCSNDDDSAQDSTTTMADMTTTTMADMTTTTMDDMDNGDMDMAEADIVDTAMAAGDFSMLISAVQAAGLEDMLRGDGPYTVFAPTDAAFEALPAGTIDMLMEDPTGDLASILAYHVVSGAVPASDVAGMDAMMVETANGASFTVNVADDGGVSLTDGAGNMVNVVMTDVMASNGVIHVIDAVLMPS